MRSLQKSDLRFGLFRHGLQEQEVKDQTPMDLHHATVDSSFALFTPCCPRIDYFGHGAGALPWFRFFPHWLP